MVDFLTTFPVILVAMAAVAWRTRSFTPEERGLLWLSFFAHQGAAIANILITQYHYEGGDMMSYHRFGVVAADRLRSDFWGLAPDVIGLIFQRTDPIPIPIGALPGSTGSVQGYSAFAMFLFNDSLYATCAFIAGLAFFSKLALYSVAKGELSDVPQRALLWACMLVPSAIFWSCALLKEPIAMIGLFGITYAFQLFIVRRRRLAGVALALFVAPLVLFTKGYLVPVLAASGGAWYLLHALRARRGEVAIKLVHVIAAAAAVIGVVLVTGALLPRYSVDALDDELARLQVAGANLDAGTNYALGSGAGSAAGQLALAPLALFTALFRPMLLEANSPLVLLSALEMTLFTIWAFMVPFRRGVFPILSEVLRRPFLAFCLVFVVVFGTCAGLGSTNLGTLSRYRMPLMPFFAIALATFLARARAARAWTGQQTPSVPRLLRPAPEPGAANSAH